MSRPARSCALMTAATASRYCSRNSDSPSADLNDRPSRLRSNHSGRGYDPVIAVGSIRFCVTDSMAPSQSNKHQHNTRDLARLREAERAVDIVQRLIIACKFNLPIQIEIGV